MEDAMILNKSAVERGLGHATMLKTEQIDLSKESGNMYTFGFVACPLHASQQVPQHADLHAHISTYAAPASQLRVGLH